MSDILFQGIPILVDSSLPSDQLILLNATEYSKTRVPLIDSTLTPEERQARAVADRLLGRSSVNGLTLDMIRRAIDSVGPNQPHTTHIILSPATRREYLALIEIDERLGLSALNDDGTHRNNYFGIPRTP